MVVLALLRLLGSSIVFSGRATLYYRFVQSMLRYWLITGSLAAVGAVVVVPVFWQGSRWQLPLAGILFTLASLALFVCMCIIREY
jgi:hypothetical protein